MDSTSKITKRHFQLITTTTICVGLLLLGCNSQKNTSDKKSTPLVKTEDVVATPSSELNPQEKISNSPSAEPAIDLQTFLDAALNGETDTIQSALNSNFDVNSTNEQKRSGVMLAAFNGHTDIVKLLVRNGASPNLRDSSGRTALMFASTGANQDTVEFLIVSGAELNAVDNSEGFTALMFAAAEGQTEVVKTLLKYKADASLKDADGESALGFASKNGHVETAKLLTD